MQKNEANDMTTYDYEKGILVDDQDEEYQYLEELYRGDAKNVNAWWAIVKVHSDKSNDNYVALDSECECLHVILASSAIEILENEDNDDARAAIARIENECDTSA